MADNLDGQESHGSFMKDKPMSPETSKFIADHPEGPEGVEKRTDVAGLPLCRAKNPSGVSCEGHEGHSLPTGEVIHFAVVGTNLTLWPEVASWSISGEDAAQSKEQPMEHRIEQAAKEIQERFIPVLNASAKYVFTQELAAILSRHLSNEWVKLRETVKQQADNAYCDSLAQLRRDECLGYEQKLKVGKFGKDELNAHCKAAELLGRHRALMAVFNLLPAPPSASTQGESK
jgi:hypothetical protein